VGPVTSEQARGEDLDARTDLFSFGVVLYEMATGERPFQGNTSAVVFHAILSQAPISAVKLRPDLPKALEQVINKALEKDPKLRYQSAAEMRTDLEQLKRQVESGGAIAGSKAARLTRRLSRRTIIAVAAAVIIALAVGARLLYRRQPRLSETDTIVLTDFANSTGDAAFDDTLKQALATELQQSPFLNIISDQKVSESMKLMGRGANERLDTKTALDLCQRVGSKAVLAGSIASLGSQYVIGLNALNCQTGSALAREQVQAARKENVLEALDKAASKLRAKLGESLSTVQKFDVPPTPATTPSLEALQAYSLGRKMEGSNNHTAAIPLFRRAIRLDPNLAMAHLSLGLSYLNLQENSYAQEHMRKAYEVRERVSEWEKFAIDSRYYLSVTGELTKARQTYELWAETYPREFTPHGQLAAIHNRLGEYDKALAERREFFSVAPGTGAAYVGLVDAYVNLNRLEEAQATAKEAQAKGLDSPNLHMALYQLEFLKDDASGMAREVAWLTGKPALESTLLASEGDTAAYCGRLEAARDFSRKAVEAVTNG